MLFEAASALALVVPILGPGISSGILHLIAMGVDAAAALMVIIYIIAYRLSDDYSSQGTALIKLTIGY